MKNRFLLIAMLLLAAMSMTAQKLEREWVDLGLASGTLWASELEDGFYNYPDAVEAFGVHLPTQWQWMELINSVNVEEYEKDRVILKGKNGNSIILSGKGYIFKNGKPQYDNNIYCWTYNSVTKKEACYVLIDAVQISSFQQTFKNSYKMSVLLVNK